MLTLAQFIPFSHTAPAKDEYSSLPLTPSYFPFRLIIKWFIQYANMQHQLIPHSTSGTHTVAFSSLPQKSELLTVEH
jgi:hypothetical protein